MRVCVYASTRACVGDCSDVGRVCMVDERREGGIEGEGGAACRGTNYGGGSDSALFCSAGWLVTTTSGRPTYEAIRCIYGTI